MVGMVLAGISLLVMGQAAPPKIHDVLRTREIQVVSAEGKILVSLMDGPLGGVIRTYNDEGNKLVEVGSSYFGKAGKISTYNLQGSPAMVITSYPSGVGYIASVKNSKRPAEGYNRWP